MNKYTKNMFKLKLRISFVKKKDGVCNRMVAWLLSTRDLVELIRGAPDVNVF